MQQKIFCLVIHSIEILPNLILSSIFISKFAHFTKSLLEIFRWEFILILRNIDSAYVFSFMSIMKNERLKDEFNSINVRKTGLTQIKVCWKRCVLTIDHMKYWNNMVNWVNPLKLSDQCTRFHSRRCRRHHPHNWILKFEYRKIYTEIENVFMPLLLRFVVFECIQIFLFNRKISI